MLTSEQITRPSKHDQKLARQSYDALEAALKQVEDNTEIEIELEETKDKIVLPVKAVRLLKDVLQAMREGKLVSIVPVATEVTTQAAAEMLGCSRPHLVKLLEQDKLPYTKVGKHRRIKFEDVVRFKKQLKAEQRQHLTDMMNSDEELGLYDS